jgi:hypothetical protein
MVQQMRSVPGLGPARDIESAEAILVPETETCSGPLTKRAVKKIRAGWLAALEGTRPADPDEQGLDGEIHRFSLFERGVATRRGKVWSPEPWTNVGALVALGHALASHACGDPSGRRSPERDLAKAAGALYVRFRLAP